MAKAAFITLPKGIAVYPALSRPDTRFDELGAYKADVRIPADQAAPYMEKLAAIWKEHTGKKLNMADNMMFVVEEDDEGNETGNVIFKARVKNKMTKAGKLWDRRPMVMDAKKAKLNTDVNVWGGSTIRVQVEPYAWIAGTKKGVSLQPIIVQVIELVSGSGAGDLGDFDEEDGYEFTDEGPDTSDFDDGGSDTEDSSADY